MDRAIVWVLVAMTTCLAACSKKEQPAAPKASATEEQAVANQSAGSGATGAGQTPEAAAAEGADAFLSPRADAHQGENVAPRDERLAWLTGFTGSAGQAIVGLEQVPGLETVVADAKAAYTDAARDTAWVAALFVFFGLMVSFGLPKDAPDRESTHSTPPT